VWGEGGWKSSVQALDRSTLLHLDEVTMRVLLIAVRTTLLRMTVQCRACGDVEGSVGSV
jgi:hypothetical protein